MHPDWRHVQAPNWLFLFLFSFFGTAENAHSMRAANEGKKKNTSSIFLPGADRRSHQLRTRTIGRAVVWHVPGRSES